MISELFVMVTPCERSLMKTQGDKFPLLAVFVKLPSEWVSEVEMEVKNVELCVTTTDLWLADSDN